MGRIKKLISLVSATWEQSISNPDLYTGVGLQIVFHVFSASMKESQFIIIVDHLDRYGTTEG